MSHALATQLAQRVADGHYPPGSNLREIPLADEFGVSRSSVREALRILERDGVVQIRARQGASVTRLSTDELIEVYQVRGALLGLAMSMFCLRRDEGQLAWLEAKYDRMVASADLPDAEGGKQHIAASTEMAAFIVANSGNQRLQRLIAQMSMQIARYTRVGLSAAERRAQSRETWGLVMQAMRARDAAAAEQAGRKLVGDTLRFALAQLAQRESFGMG